MTTAADTGFAEMRLGKVVGVSAGQSKRRDQLLKHALARRRYAGKTTGLPGNDQTALVGEDNQLGAVPGFQFHQDVRYM